MRDNQLKSTGLAGLFIAVAIAVFFILRYFPDDFLLGTSSYWNTETEDVTQYISGFNAYFQAPFSWPLLAFDSFNYPVGTRVTFLDALPLYALLLKVFVPAHFAPFNPFGVWVGLAFVLQAVCAWWILKELRIASWLALITLVTLFVLSPAFLARVPHTSLFSQWIVLGALALYIRSVRLSQLRPVAWTLWLAMSFYLNIYLFTMATAIYIAAFFTVRGYQSFRQLAWAALPVVVIGVSLLITVLPLPREAVAPEGGFGVYSMNLLSPISGASLMSIPNASMPGQGEGYNYLGLGVILAFLVALRLNQTRPTEVFTRHRALFILMLLFTLYALSNHVYFGTVEVLTLNYPDFMNVLTSQFRASGRFFWPVGYCIIVFSVVMLYRNTRRLVFAVLMLALLFVQVVDLRSVRHNFVDTINRPPSKILTAQQWDAELGKDVAHLYFYPKFRCPNPDVLQTLMPLMRYSAERGLTLNTGYIARHQPACDTASLQAEISKADPARSAFLFNQSVYGSVESIQPLFPANVTLHCNRVDFAYVCKAHASKE
ncbi:hypothetical protein PS3A_02350 [Pseudomonas sp. 3A(2025)]